MRVVNRSKIYLNILTGFGGQLIAIILGLIVPRLFITSYGSDVNGVLSTVGQIFGYMALLEAGIGQAAKNLLYKPFRENDRKQISHISSIAKTYFTKFTIIYGIGVGILTIFIPCLLKTETDSLTVALIVLFEGMSGVVTFYFIQTPSIIIAVDGKTYINNGITLANKILGYVVKIVMATSGINVIFLQLTYFLITVAKVFVYQHYFKKNYSWIKMMKTGKGEKLKDRNAFILTEICWTIFSSTDMIVLSFFLSTRMSSVYGIYNMVFANITLLVNAIFSSVSYLIGYTYHESLEKYAQLHDAFNSIFLGIITILMSVCYVLTNPFVALYTRGVTDIDYIYSTLPLMFCLIQIISWSRYTSGLLTGIAGYAKQTSYISLVEAVINLGCSIIFVQKYGILGVTFATVIALPLKVIWCTYIVDKKVLKRSYKKSLSIMGMNYIFFFFVVVCSKFVHLSIETYGQFFLWGVIITFVCGMIGITLNFLVNRNMWNIIRRYILKK